MDTAYSTPSFQTVLEERMLAHIRQVAAAAPASLGEAGKLLLHGTTIGAFTIESGRKAVAFSDGQVSMGNKPVHRAYRKILSVDSHTRMLIAGSPVLGIDYDRILKMQIGFREDTRGPMTSRAKINILARMLFHGLGLMGAGIVCAPIVVTYDTVGKQRARIFSLGPEGSEVEYTDAANAFTTSGSGSNVDVHLISAWKPDMTEEQGVALARTVIGELAPGIDVFSGGRVSIDVIGESGIRTIQ
jgi:20S proteasome alpha/beta subunit